MKLDEEKVNERAREIAESGWMEEEEARNKIYRMSPKRLYKLGLLEDEWKGWRPGNTKQTLEKRKRNRRRKKGKKS